MLGFGARAMAEGRGPKYLNTSENEIYHKGRQLFGIDLARSHAAKSGRIVVVEGYTDVLALHQAGIRESVAIMGTALTAEQMAELGRAAPLVVLALDADRSGQEAMLRAAAARRRGAARRGDAGRQRSCRFACRAAARMPSRSGLERRSAMIQFQVRRVLADADLDTPAGRDRALEEARGLIAATPERTAMRDELVREIADRLDVPAEYVRAPGRAAAPRFERPAASAPVLPAGASAGEVAFRAEREFLTLLPCERRPGTALPVATVDDQFSSGCHATRTRHTSPPTSTTRWPASPRTSRRSAALVTDVVHAAQEQPAKPESVLRMSILQLEGRRIEREIRRASQEGDHARHTELAAAEQRVRTELGEVMGQTA